MRVIITYCLLPSGGGVLIDPDGPESAVRDLLERYGTRLDRASVRDNLKALDLLTPVVHDWLACSD